MSDGAPVEVLESGPSVAARVANLTSRVTIRPVLSAGSHVPNFPWPWGLIDLAARVVLPVSATVRETVKLPNASAQLVRAPGVLPADGTRRVVVYFHGGAFLTCGANSHGRLVETLSRFADSPVLVVNYRLLPKHSIGMALDDCHDGYQWLRLHGYQPEQIVLAGDSAGAQLASELAGITTNPSYATVVGITPALSPTQLVGMILNCGVYYLQRMSELNGIEAWGFKISLWAYTGTKDWSDTSAGATMSSLGFVTSDFPATYISGGNGDALTWVESVPMSNALKAAGVEVDELFWAADHEPALPHEYQFHLDYDDAHTALDRTLAFLEAHTDAS